MPFEKKHELLQVSTPYGDPSGPISVFDHGEIKVAFIPRHGYEHTIPPHRVPYKANLMAMKLLGIRHVMATCVVGSLRQEIEPGSFVVPSQFINLTWGRDDTYDLDQGFIHLPMAQPYCSCIRNSFITSLTELGYAHYTDGCVAVIQGPRFSTIAESRMLKLLGGDIVNMTQYPEAYFARELGLCYGVVASVTDYDVGVPSSISMQPETMERVLEVFKLNTERTVRLLKRILDGPNETFQCSCAQAGIEPYFKK